MGLVFGLYNMAASSYAQENNSTINEDEKSSQDTVNLIISQLIEAWALFHITKIT